MKLPSKERLEFVKLLAETLLLLMLVPVAIWGILRDPQHAADKAIGRV